MSQLLIDTLPSLHTNYTGWPWTLFSEPLPEKAPDNFNWPRISIVTPSLNQGKFLEASIYSVLSQGYPNLEYIIIDGGSTDNSVEIIKKYQDHIHYWCNEPDDGHYAAINKGFNNATGDIFAWINSDDLYCPWALRTVAHVFTQLQHVQWLSTLSPLCWDAHGFIAHTKHLAGFSKEAFLDGCYLPKWSKRIGWIQQESTFWRRELWEEAGGLREEIKLAADFDLWARFYNLSELHGIKTPLGGFRWHSDQRSLDISGYFEEAEASLLELRETCGYIEKRQPPLRRFFSKIPKMQRISNHYYRSKYEKYSGTQLVHAGREYPGRWKEINKTFSPEYEDVQ